MAKKLESNSQLLNLFLTLYFVKVYFNTDVIFLAEDTNLSRSKKELFPYFKYTSRPKPRT